MSNLIIPETRFTIIDDSGYKPVIDPQPTLPVYLCAFASSKGPEDMHIVYKNFEDTYGEMNFSKYGQPLIQAAIGSKSGALVVAKRVVAKDAKLGNIAVIAKVKKTSEPKLNKEGKPVYRDKSTGEETTVKGDNTEEVKVDTCCIRYEVATVPEALNIDQVADQISAKFKEEGDPGIESTYPLFVLTENGRGTTKKKFKIEPDYTSAKLKNYIPYNLIVIEDNKILENIPFSLDTNVVEAGKNKSIQNMVREYSNQLNCKMFDTNISKFIEKIKEYAKPTTEAEKAIIDSVESLDILFGRDKKRFLLPSIKVTLDGAEENCNLSYPYGIELKSGSNGAFGDYPLETREYEERLVEFFDGTYTPDIFDVDKYKFDVILDAAYPISVKRRISALVTWREDLMFFRDCGTGKKTLDEILYAKQELLQDDTDNTCFNKFIADYYIAYDTIDPFTKKQIPVTVTFTLAKKLVNHFKGGRHRPLAGEKFDFILSDAIEGTINFIPKRTPDMDQKEKLAEHQINYASYYEDKLILETFWTSQDALTQLSHVNNVLAIQEVIKAVRNKCPKIRYSFQDGDDLEKYKEDVNEVLNKYANNFYKLSLVYLKDPTMIVNKIFYAAIMVTHRDFINAERFKLYVINKEEV